MSHGGLTVIDFTIRPFHESDMICSFIISSHNAGRTRCLLQARVEGEFATDCLFVAPVGVTPPWHRLLHLCVSFWGGGGITNAYKQRTLKWITRSKHSSTQTRTRPARAIALLFLICPQTACRWINSKTWEGIWKDNVPGPVGVGVGVVLGHVSREFVYMQRIGSPQRLKWGLPSRCPAHSLKTLRCAWQRARVFTAELHSQARAQCRKLHL